MKQLRILTGRHAGAQLPLTRRTYRIASDDEADLQIGDWDHAPLLLNLVEEEGTDVSLALHCIGDDGQAARALGPLADFVPRRFGDVVLCAGPDGAAGWPKDVDLMAALINPPKIATPTTRSPGLGLKLGALALGAALLAGFGAVLSLQTSATASATEPVSPLERVQIALRQAGVTGLTVRSVDRRLVVEGLLATTAELARARTALQPFGEELLHRYAAAADLARQIGDALGRPGLRVAYRGAGVFAVEGQDLDPAQVRTDAARVADDIGPLITRLDVDIAEMLPASRVRVGAMLNGEEFQYVQTADGIKHLSLRTPIDELVDAAPAASAVPANPGEP